MATQSEKSEAPAGVTTMAEALATGRLPESGPSDTSKAVAMTSPTGTKVRVPERMADRLKGQGYKRG